MKLKNVTGLIEYQGDFYSAEEMQEKLGITGDFELVTNEEDETWFGKAMMTLRDKSGDQ